jgi:hypothetical protein
MDSEERSLDEVHHHAEQEAEYGNAYHGNDEEESAGSEGIEIDDDGRMMEEETHSRLAVFHSSQKSVFVGSRTPPSLEANFLNLQNVGGGSYWWSLSFTVGSEYELLSVECTR